MPLLETLLVLLSSDQVVVEAELQQVEVASVHFAQVLAAVVVAAASLIVDQPEDLLEDPMLQLE